MKRRIYYFSATGNSYWAAGALAEGLQGAVPLVDMTKEPHANVTDTDEIGFVFPLHFYGVPPLVMRFIQRLCMSKDTSVFVLVTAMFPMGIAMEQLKEIFIDKGISIRFARYLTMPNNYILSHGTSSKPREDRLIHRAEKEIKGMVKDLESGKSRIPREWGLYNKMVKSRRSYNHWMTELDQIHLGFEARENCTNCGQCQRQCPLRAIDSGLDRPQWKSGCQLCLRCLHFCPRQAIEYKNLTQGKKRYTRFRSMISSS